MLRNTDVSLTMDRVAAAIRRAGRIGAADGVLFVHPVPSDPFGIQGLRGAAVLVVDQPSGSARPLVGPLIRFAKRVFRRIVRWYAQPVAVRQSEINIELLNVDERIAELTVAARTGAEELEARVNDLEGQLDRLGGDLEQMQALTRSREPDGEAIDHSVQELLKYSGFEARHRGSEATLRPLLSEYVAYFSGCRRVLDIGCGRGEFLALLGEAGVSGYGVDSDRSMVQVAVERGIDARLVDAVAHLRSLAVGDVDGMFSSQVAEHLTVNQLVTTIELAFRKLAPGGVFVMETPNPEALFIFSTFFYVDLTHIKPIHPEALKWAFDAAGFDEVEIKRVQRVPDSARLIPIPEELRSELGWETLAGNIEKLNDLIYGYQHYAVIGRKLEVGE